MTNLRYIADHPAIPPLNIRPVESGIIPDHFSPIEKISCSPRPLKVGPTNPRCILEPTHALPDQGPFIADPCIFPERERAGVDRLSGVNGPLLVT